MPSSLAFFDAIAPRYDRDYARESTLVRERVAMLARALRAQSAQSAQSGDHVSEKHVLDLGIGTGRELPALLDAGFRVTGIDASPRMLAECCKRARAVPVVEGDFFAPLPFPDASFDAVIALHGTLAHPPDDGALARLAAEAARVLVRGGIFFAEVPSPAWLDAVAQGLGTDTDREASRLGANRARLVDRRSGASIEAVVLDRDAWSAVLTPAFTPSIEAISPYEWLVLGTRH